MKYYEIMYELLARQYELAKIDEARDAAVIQVMDKAIEPDRKSKPTRSLIVLLSTFAAGLFSILLAFVLEAMAKARNDPEQSQRLARLKAYLRVRKD